nr:unnamed protein product [Digitaria exilis]
MADAGHHNPTVEALDDDLIGRIQDLDAVRRHVDLVRAQIAENDALYAEAATQFAQSRRRLEEAEAAAAATAASLALPEPKSDKEVTELALKLGGCARRRALGGRCPRPGDSSPRDASVRCPAVSLLVARAISFAVNRVHLLPGVLLTVAAAYALAYVVSWGAVVPGPASLSRITILLLCFLFGVPVVGNLA